MVKNTPLFEKHVGLNARMIEFFGWNMPVEYEGIIKEHRAVRENAGIFDLSHMGEIKISGVNCKNFVQKIVTNDISRLPVGGILYSEVCNNEGGIVDDVLVYNFEDHIFMVVNASNIEKILGWFKKNITDGVIIEDLTNVTALIAVQGPKAEGIVQAETEFDLKNLIYYNGLHTEVCGKKVLLSRTGYTGEDGFEIYCKNEDAGFIWDKFIEKCTPIGLGARDTLRLEACYPLYGHELGDEINPLEAGVAWTVKFKKGDFIGKESLLKIKEAGIKRKLIAFEMHDRAVPRQNYGVFLNGEKYGWVTSGTFSPSLSKSVGLAYLSDVIYAEPGNIIDIEIRNKFFPAKIVNMPFYSGSVKSKTKKQEAKACQ